MIGKRTFVAVALLGALASACGSEDTAQPSSSSPAAGEPLAAAPEEARASWEDTGFRLDASANGPFTAGEEGNFEIRLAATGIYHVNQEYPISVEITGPDGVTLPRATLGRAEAAVFNEQLARFEVPFVAGSGQHDLRAVVDFAVCTDEGCMPDRRTLAVALNVP